MFPFNDVSVPGVRNRLLAALPAATLDRLRHRLDRVELSLHEVIQTPDRPNIAVYFPESGIVSMLAHFDDGNAAEVGLAGRDGMVGLPLLLGADHDGLEGMVQAAGTALRLDAIAFHEELERCSTFRSLLLRYTLVHHGQVAQTAACNGRHQIERRLARWLLMAHDLIDGNQFAMTHEFLSIMLGVRRSGISVAANTLRNAELIRYDRGRIEIIHRPGLENVACECYGITRRAHDTLFEEAGTRRDQLSPSQGNRLADPALSARLAGAD